MLDLRLRPMKERVLAPLARALAGRVSADTITGIGFLFCVGTGLAAWQGFAFIAVVSWLVGRALDGIDGALARAQGTASDFGGYADLLLDTIGYTVVPLGIAFGANDIATWQVVAVLIGTLYVNSVSWLMLSALLEKRSRGATARGEQTSVTMPTGLVEGTETIVLFTIALAVPSIAPTVFVVMAAGVTIGVVQRAVAARSLLAASGSAHP